MADSTGKKWLLGCGIGCGALILITVLGLVGSSFFFMRSFRGSIATREALDERHGEQAAFTPALDGAVTTERMEAFLAVRSAVMERCPEFEGSAQQMKRMDTLDEDAPKTEVFVEVVKMSGSIFGMLPAMGGFFAARNTALAEVDMGLGEYTYIYAMAYLDRLRPGGIEDGASMFGDAEPSLRIREVLLEMLRNQLSAVESAASGESRADSTQFDVDLRAEIARLEDDPDRLPWQDGLPPAIDASLAPYRARLDEVFCAATAGLELTRNRQRGLSIQGD